MDLLDYLIVILLLISVFNCLKLFLKNKHQFEDYSNVDEVDTEYDYEALLKEIGILKDEHVLFSEQWIDYMDCLEEYKYDNFCGDKLVANRNFSRQYGYVTANIDSIQRLFSLHKVVNMETEEFLYYVQTDSKKEYLNYDIENGEKVTIDDIEYTIFLFDNTVFIDIVDPLYESYNYNFAKYNDDDEKFNYPFGYAVGYIKDDNNEENRFDIYKQYDEEDKWIYYVGDGSTVVPLIDYSSIEDQDTISTQFDDNSYTFFKY